jgi:acyl carrier protein
MSDIAERLVGCFQSVFPALSRDEVISAKVGQTSTWDSLANLALLSVIEEEFEIQIPADDLEHLSSFAAVEKYLEAR